MIFLNPLDELQVGQEFILFTLQSFKNLLDKFILLRRSHQINWFGDLDKHRIALLFDCRTPLHSHNVSLTADIKIERVRVLESKYCQFGLTRP